MRKKTQPLSVLYALSVIGSGAGFMTQILVSGFWSTAFSQDVYFYSVNLAVYFLSLGIGTHLSTKIRKPTLPVLFALSIGLCFWTGLSISLLRWGIYRFNQANSVALLTVAMAGVLAGAILPLTLRIGASDSRMNLGRLFFLDYLAAILFTFLFTFVLLIPLGYTRTALVLSTASLALIAGFAFHSRLRRYGVAALLLAALAWPAAYGARALSNLQTGVRGAKVVLSTQTHYQKIVITESTAGQESLTPGLPQHSLYLDGFIQFSSGSEQLYHFCIANIPLTAAEYLGHPARDVLVLGGGDGLVVRNLVAQRSIRSVKLVELDPVMINLAKNQPILRRYNLDSFRDPRVEVLVEDAFTWVAKAKGRYDLILIDFPTPKNLALARLFSAEFYRRVFALLRPHGFVAIQAGPYFSASDKSVLSHITSGIRNTVQSTGASAFVYFTPRDRDAFVLATRDPVFSMEAFSQKVGIHPEGPLAGVCAHDSQIRLPATQINTLNTLPLAADALAWYREIGGRGFFFYGDYYGVFLPD